MYSHSEDIHNLKSAKIIWPLIFQIYRPSSILDVGCGIGTWLKAAKDLGINDVFGIDSHYVDQKLLSKYIGGNEFLGHDLRKPFNLGKNFDLVICLEVAEHLPVSSADILIETLTSHSNVVLFSAAIPGQGGQNHLNEQSPEYWIHKFSNLGFEVYDPIRPKIWDMDEVDIWYRQNILMFSKKTMDLLKPPIAHIVHPQFYEIMVDQKNRLKEELARIKDAQVSPKFYLKRMLISLFR